MTAVTAVTPVPAIMIPSVSTMAAGDLATAWHRFTAATTTGTAAVVATVANIDRAAIPVALPTIPRLLPAPRRPCPAAVAEAVMVVVAVMVMAEAVMVAAVLVAEDVTNETLVFPAGST
jgi:hypothetical protein